MDGAAFANPIGWRAKIGVIVPPSNTVNEAEFNRMAPDGVTFHFTRSPLHADPAADDFVTMMNDVEAACGDLAACNVGSTVYACTAGSMACPSDRLLGKMQDVKPGPATSTAEAILAVFKALGVRKIAMASPYTDETNAHEKHYLEDHGLDVLTTAGLGLNTSLENIQKICRVPPAEVFDHARAVDVPEAEALLICCTDFNTLDVIDKLEQDLGKPVVSSNTATFWAALRGAGIDDKIEGYGRLLAEH